MTASRQEIHIQYRLHRLAEHQVVGRWHRRVRIGDLDPPVLQRQQRDVGILLQIGQRFGRQILDTLQFACLQAGETCLRFGDDTECHRVEAGLLVPAEAGLLLELPVWLVALFSIAALWWKVETTSPSEPENTVPEIPDELVRKI